MICFYNYDLSVSAPPNNKDRESSNNSKFFALVCLDILNLLLDNIQKSSIIENEAIYFDLIQNFLYKSKKNGIFGLTGLDKSRPFASGLEPMQFNHDGLHKIVDRCEVLSVSALHNNSNGMVNGETQDPILTETINPFGNQVRLHAYQGFFKIIKIMKLTYFASNFQLIFEYIWSLLKNS